MIVITMVLVMVTAIHSNNHSAVIVIVTVGRLICIHVVIKPEFSKFPKKIKVWSLSSSRCNSVSVDFVSQKKSRLKVFMSFIEDSTAEFTGHEVH